MTKTEHYQLPQWAANDPLRREDFNRAMASIDEGLGTARHTANGMEAMAYNLSDVLFALKANGFTPACKGLAGDDLVDGGGFPEIPYGYSYDAAGKRLRYFAESLTGEQLVSATATNIGPGSSGASAVWVPEKNGHTEKIRFLASCTGVIFFYFTISCNGSVVYKSQTYSQTGNWQYTDMPEVNFDFLAGQQYQFTVYNTSSSSSITTLNGFQIYFTAKAAVSTIDTQPFVIGCDSSSAVAWVHYAGTCPAVSLLTDGAVYPMEATGEAVQVGTGQYPDLLCQRFSADITAGASDTAALRFTAQGDYDLHRWNLWMW